MPYRKALVSSTSPKMTQHEYNEHMNQFYKAFPFCVIQGHINPYTGTQINTWHDYMLYGHCYVMKKVSENKLTFLESTYQSTIVKLDSENLRLSTELTLLQKKQKFLDAETSRLTNDLITLQRKRKFTLLLTVILCFLCCVSIFLPTPLKNDFLFLQDENASLQNEISSLKEANASLQKDLEKANKEIDRAYINGLMFSQRDSSSSTSSYSTYRNYDSTPSVETYYIGNISTKKFHRSTCGYLPSQQNQIALSTREDAITSGYDPCRRCNP